MVILAEILRDMLLQVLKTAKKVLPLTENAAAGEITPTFGVNS